MNLKNRVAVITGAGRGLGKSYALELARCGAKVVVNDPGVSEDGKGHSYEIAQNVVNEINYAGGDAVADYNNVAEKESAFKIIETALDAYGTIDILINNAGILRDKSFIKMSIDDFDQVIKVHLYGTFYVTKAAFPVFKAKKYGRIIMITSTSALYGNFGQANYDAAKLGVVGLMNALKEEGKLYNIMVNAIAPLAVSRLGEGVFPPEANEILKPEHIAPLVAFLSSAACETSGCIISAGGGYFTRDQMFQGKGCLIDCVDLTAEEIRDKFSTIIEMKEKKTYSNATEAALEIWQKVAR